MALWPVRPRFGVGVGFAALVMLGNHDVAAGQSETGTRRMRGRVIDATTSLPVAGVGVLLTRGADTVSRATTDSTGSFVATVDDSSMLMVHFRWVGYRPDSIAGSLRDGFPLRVALAPLEVATRLAPVRVAASARSGFERRARRNSGGYFIRRADIEKKKPLRTSELFSAIPGVAVADSAGITKIVSMRGYRRTQPMPASGQVGRGGRPATIVGDEMVSGPESAGERCSIRVSLNGQFQDAAFSVNDVKPEEIEGIETYMGVATIPIEFSTVQRNAICGLIVIWTRLGPSRQGGS